LGAWGIGIYANDFALDLKSTVVSVLRLPLDVDGLIDLLAVAEPSLLDPQSEDHTGCWFVVADQLHKYGIVHPPTIKRVQQYVESGKDIEMMRLLGMSPVNLRKRKRTLDKLLVRISTPNPKPFRRRILTQPQAQVSARGEVLALPIMHKPQMEWERSPQIRTANPYFKSWEEDGFFPDAYGAALVVQTGYSFNYLAWTRISMLDSVWPTIPTFDQCLAGQLTWCGYGTFSQSHYKRMGATVVGRRVLTATASERLTPSQEINYRMSCGPDYVTTNDISICNITKVPEPTSRALSGVTLRAVVAGP
jgi:hypothetical protein